MARGYRTSEYSIFRVHEPKERVIYRLPFYPDRIMHHAIMNVMEEIWTSVFTHNTYSCIKGRGIEACRKRVRRVIDEHKDKRLYCLKIDIRKFLSIHQAQGVEAYSEEEDQGRGYATTD